MNVLPPLPNRREPSKLQLVTVAALLLQFAALAFTMWHGARVLRTLEARERALETLLHEVEIQVTVAPHGAPAPSAGQPSAPAGQRTPQGAGGAGPGVPK